MFVNNFFKLAQGGSTATPAPSSPTPAPSTPPASPPVVFPSPDIQDVDQDAYAVSSFLTAPSEVAYLSHEAPAIHLRYFVDPLLFSAFLGNILQQSFYGGKSLLQRPITGHYKLFSDPRISGFAPEEILRQYRAALKSRLYTREKLELLSNLIAKEILKRKRIAKG